MVDEINNDSLLELYLFESTSLLNSLDDILLKSETEGSLSSENINEIFRIMHTLKGSSAMMAFQSIADVSHQTEELFAEIRASGLNIKWVNELFDVVLAVSDFLKTEIDKVQEGQGLEIETEPLISVILSLTKKMHDGSSVEQRADLGRTLGGMPDSYSTPQQTVDTVTKPDELIADISKVTHNAAEDLSDGRDTCYLHIHFNEGSKMENIRAFMLVNKLNEKGVVNRTIPANPEAEPDAANAIIENGFYVSYTTTLFREQIEMLVKGTLSVESVSFVRRMPDETGAPSADKKPLKPEPRPQAAKQPPPMQWPIFEPISTPSPQTPGRPVFIDITKQPEEPLTQKNTIPVNPQTEPPPQQPKPPEPSEPLAPPVPASLDKIEHVQPVISHTNQNIISVELKKLDALLDLVGEIVINESIVTQNPELEGIELEGFTKASRHLDKLTKELQDAVMSIRMLPVAIVFQRMRRIVRDMGKSLGKDANLILVGEATEVDKTILDALSDPIMHLIRNAMDHAIETPAERGEAGKSITGHIILSAQNSGSDVIISISDDGRGLDKELIFNKARVRGLLKKPENEYSDKEIFNLLMAPGFSTREIVSEFSGRGVGLDVVKSNIEKIGGSITIESKIGLGTNIIMKIPLTLAIISCMEILVGKEVYSIPIGNIRESFKASAGQTITDPSGCEMILLRGQAYPVIRLYKTFNCDDAITDINDGILVLVDAGDNNTCLMADKLIGKFQIVVKPLPTYLNRFGVKRSGISGCTIMGTGNISLVINVQELAG